MNQKLAILFLMGTIGMGSCSSLQESTADQKMRFQGSFSCPPVSHEKMTKETLAEADVSRVRCAKDEWVFHGDQVQFTRTLYQFKECETVLGRIEFASPIDDPKPSCKLIRVNSGWVGEESGRCMLNELKLNTPYPLHSVLRCQNYVPAWCGIASPGFAIRFAEPGKQTSHDPYSEIFVQPKGGSSMGGFAEMTCKRYAAE